MGGGVRARFGRSLSGFVSSNVFIDPRVSEPVDEKARLALALYREDLSVNSVPYQFLGFAKIINVLHAGGSAQKAWIGAVLPNVTDADARARLAELSGEVADVSAYLFESGRCAVAHANTSPVVNPDDVGLPASVEGSSPHQGSCRASDRDRARCSAPEAVLSWLTGYPARRWIPLARSAASRHG